ncbi:MAG: class I SAM-dependent methyltransferase [Variovorax sp.]|nr:MAG: class I SAM-dependent methyltransferase [Variovorax sp.]
MASVSGTAGYDAHAATLVTAYESITFEDVHRDVIHLFPAAPSRVLDVGAGTGRDAAALARRGHHVVAVEPTPGLRSAGERLHAALPITWIDDHLPDLAVLRQQPERFDLVLLTAVWMHLDAAERATAMAALADLLAEAGQIVMTLRHGPVPEGRRMFDVSADETGALAKPHGLIAHHSGARRDTLGRDDVRWSVLALRRATVPAPVPHG